MRQMDAKRNNRDAPSVKNLYFAFRAKSLRQLLISRLWSRWRPVGTADATAEEAEGSGILRIETKSLQRAYKIFLWGTAQRRLTATGPS